MSDYDLNNWNSDEMPTKQTRKNFKKKDEVIAALDRSDFNPFPRGSKNWKRFNSLKNSY